MHERLALVKLSPTHIVDAGCGEGSDLSLLQKRFPEAFIMGVDASAPMLLQARASRIEAMSSVTRLLQQWLPSRIAIKTPDAGLICGDYAQLPLAASTVDLVWSNLALHWHPQPDIVFAEWRRILRQDGLLMFSCFGPDTFKELRQAFAGVDADSHVLPFIDMHDFGDMLVGAGFSTPVMDMETITVTYGTFEKLIDDVRAWGGNPLDTRPRGLYGKSAWDKVKNFLEQRRQTNGTLPLTFEVVYGHAFRPAPRTNASGESIIRFDLPRK